MFMCRKLSKNLLKSRLLDNIQRSIGLDLNTQFVLTPAHVELGDDRNVISTPNK